MALRPATKTRSKDSGSIEEAPLVVDQRKRTEERFRLQVDRQTKRSFATLAAAVDAGSLIKKSHPVVQVWLDPGASRPRRPGAARRPGRATSGCAAPP
jgi:hypothetical protein